MSEPILRAAHCPPDMLPPNARTLLALASERGWEAHASLAIGYPTEDSEPVKSVVVRARRPGQYVEARWERPADDSKPWSFAKGWRRPGAFGFPLPCGANEIKSIVKGVE